MNLQADLTESDLAQLEQAGIVAVDCEMGGLNPHRDSLYLVQICDPAQNIYLIKNTGWQSAANLAALFANPRVTKIFHFAIMDCAFIHQYCGVEVQSPYCTKIASKIARTYSSNHSLSALVEEFMGVALDKSVRTSFWGAADLSPEQLAYAANDVRHLIHIRERLEDILANKGSLATGRTYAEVNAACQAFIPTLVHLWVNGWDFGKEDLNSIFGR